MLGLCSVLGPVRLVEHVLQMRINAILARLLVDVSVHKLSCIPQTSSCMMAHMHMHDSSYDGNLHVDAFCGFQSGRICRLLGMKSCPSVMIFLAREQRFSRELWHLSQVTC